MSRTRLVKEQSSRAMISLDGVGVRYRLFCEKHALIKWRLLAALTRQRSQVAEFWALRNVSFEARPGDVIGVIGPNGSGKSTLLRVIAGMIPAAEGNVATAGTIHGVLDPGSVFSGYLTGRENALLYLTAHAIPRHEAEELIPRVKEFAELGPFFDVPVKTYSSGMLCRLSFAVATLSTPDILLVDEALAVGDEHFQRKSYFRMMKLIDRGSIVIVVTHNLAFVEQVCNRALFLHSGKVMADGRPKDVIPAYQRRIA